MREVSSEQGILACSGPRLSRMLVVSRTMSFVSSCNQGSGEFERRVAQPQSEASVSATRFASW